ncbi:hypothetical protein B9N54_02305 [Finegoldia magna]|nr:hypothetical protein B9N54_02305 [Finegoldia magna]
MQGTHEEEIKKIKQNIKSIKLIKKQIVFFKNYGEGSERKWTQKNKSHFPSSETTLIFRANCT